MLDGTPSHIAGLLACLPDNELKLIKTPKRESSMYGAIPSSSFCIFIDVKLCYCVEVMVMARLVNDTMPAMSS